MIKSKCLLLAAILLIGAGYCNAQKITMKIGTTVTAVGGEDIRALEFGVEAATSYLSGSGPVVGKPKPGSLKIKKTINKSTSSFLMNIVKGLRFPEVIFEYYDASNVLYYVITLTDAFVTNLLWLSPECPSCLKLEHQVEFTFKTMKTDDKINRAVLTWDIPSLTIQ